MGGAPSGKYGDAAHESSGDCEIDGLRALEVGLDLEGDLLAFAERAQARLFDGADMDENVLAAVSRRDETKTLVGVEELYGTSDHCRAFACKCTAGNMPSAAKR